MLGRTELRANGKLGVGIYFDKVGYLAPAVYTHFVRKFEAQQDVIVFFHLRQLIAPTVISQPSHSDQTYTDMPQVRHEERFITQRVGAANTFRIIVRHGYNDHVFTDDFGTVLYDQLKAFLSSELASHRLPIRERASRDLAALDAAYEKQVVYMLGKEELKIRPKGFILKRAALAAFVWMRENTRTKVQELNVPIGQLVEVGYVKEI